jgi:hypothetical protein
MLAELHFNVVFASNKNAILETASRKGVGWETEMVHEEDGHREREMEMGVEREEEGEIEVNECTVE